MTPKKPVHTKSQKKGNRHRPNTKQTKVKPRTEKRFAKVLQSKTQPLSAQSVHSIAKKIYAEYHWKPDADHKTPEKAVNAMSEALLNLYAQALNIRTGQKINARQFANAIRLIKITNSEMKFGIEKTRRISEKLANGKTTALLENLEKIAFEQASGQLLKNYNKEIKNHETQHKHEYWKDNLGRNRKIPLKDLAKLVNFASHKTATRLYETNSVLRLWLGKKII